MMETCVVEVVRPQQTLSGPRKVAYSVRRASDLMSSWGVCFGIYGPAGVGKSTLAAQAVHSQWAGKVGVIDAEGGARAYGDRPDIDVISVRDSDDKHDSGMGYKVVDQVLDDLVARRLVPQDADKYGTIIVDNCSEINAFCMYDVLRTVPRNISDNDRPDQKDWNTTTSRMLLLFRRWRDFAQESGTNVIFICWDRAQDDKVTGIAKKDVAFNPALSNQMPGLVDAIGYLTYGMKDGERKLSFKPGVTTAAKFRRNANEIAMTIPAEFIYDVGGAFKPMADIIDCLKGGVAFPAGRYRGVGPASARAVAAPPSESPTDPVRGVIRG